MIETGTPAPDFTLPADTGEDITLSQLRPAPVVLFFYPRDDTPGCTTESLDFTRLAPEFAALGVKVFGISKDTIAKHCKFRDRHELAVPLLSDAESDVCEAFGVWVEKNMYGRKSMGIQRSTVLIDASGTVQNAWAKVKVPGHADAVLEAARAL